MYCRFAATQLRFPSCARGLARRPAPSVLSPENRSNIRSILDPDRGNILSRVEAEEGRCYPQLGRGIRATSLDCEVPESLRALTERFDGHIYESLIVLFFDGSGIYIKEARLSCGNISRIIGRFRPIIEIALSVGASKLLLAHNHPSGNPRPSAADVRFTQNLSMICRALDISLVDHVILGRTHALSMREADLL